MAKKTEREGRINQFENREKGALQQPAKTVCHYKKILKKQNFSGIQSNFNLCFFENWSKN